MEFIKQCGINLNLETIQAIRMVSAIMESDYQIYIKEEDKQIFDYLQKFFKMKVNAGLNGVPILSDLSINHTSPSCSIGSITKPLIFPKAVFDLCRSKWKNERNITYYFSGLLTYKRFHILHEWMWHHSSQSKFRNNLNYLLLRIHNRYVQSKTRRVEKGFASELTIKLSKNEDLCLASSTIGRHFPEKSWDDSYFNQMSNAKFVLCPDGDFVWTYRFLEAILCGAIPIVENETEIFEGFHYYRMHDQTNRYVYEFENVLDNYALALDRFTITSEILNREIDELLGKRSNKESVC